MKGWATISFSTQCFVHNVKAYPRRQLGGGDPMYIKWQNDFNQSLTNICTSSQTLNFLSSHLFLTSCRQPLIVFVPCFYTLSSIFITVLSLYQIWFYGRKEIKKYLPRGPITPSTKDHYFMTIEYVCVSISVLLSVVALFETISAEWVNKIRQAKNGILSLATTFLINLPT